MGNVNDRIIDFGHDKISTFGIGDEYSKREWQAIYRQLIALNYLKVSSETGGISIAPDGMEFLKSKSVIMLKKLPNAKEKRAAKSKAQLKISDADFGETEQNLLESLKAKRRELANLPRMERGQSRRCARCRRTNSAGRRAA